MNALEEDNLFIMNQIQEKELNYEDIIMQNNK